MGSVYGPMEYFTPWAMAELNTSHQVQFNTSINLTVNADLCKHLFSVIDRQ